jgi:hypothetical protein
VTTSTSANTTAVYLTIGREVRSAIREERPMTIHSISKTVLLRAGIAFAIWAGATALWQGRVNGFEQEPAAAASEVAPAFPGLHSGVYQQNLLIQVIEDPI